MMLGPVNRLEGKRFGKLTVCAYIAGSKASKSKWICQCDCGEVRHNSTASLKSGRIRSCGCGKADAIGAAKRSHGHSAGGRTTATFRAWTNMKSRCHNPKSSAFAYYGARGISVCEEWRASFLAFLADMGDAPPGMSLDREDVNGNYCKANCRWATKETQANNTRSNRMLDVDGVKMTLTQAARKFGINDRTLWTRLERGWDVKRALTSPLRYPKKLPTNHP